MQCSHELLRDWACISPVARLIHNLSQTSTKGYPGGPEGEMRFLCLHGRGTNAKVYSHVSYCVASHRIWICHSQLTDDDQIFEMQTGNNISVPL